MNTHQLLSVFGVIPSLEAKINPNQKSHVPHQYVVIDMTRVHRLETAAVQALRSNAREAKTSTIVLCGLFSGSGPHADLERGGLKLRFLTSESKDSTPTGPNEIRAFDNRIASIEWCRSQTEKPVVMGSSELTINHSKPAFGSRQS